jgi:hypothetical protein
MVTRKLRAAAPVGTQRAFGWAGNQFQTEGFYSMKKLFTLMCTLAVVFALALPVSAKTHKAKKETASTTATTKAHAKHAKKGATKGKKKGQQSENPGKSK